MITRDVRFHSIYGMEINDQNTCIRYVTINDIRDGREWTKPILGRVRVRIRTDLQLKLRLSLDHICRNVYHNTTPEMSRRPSRGGENLIAKSKHSKKSDICLPQSHHSFNHSSHRKSVDITPKSKTKISIINYYKKCTF